MTEAERDANLAVLATEREARARALLAMVGASLAKIGADATEAAMDGLPAAQAADDCIVAETRRLASAGQHGLAGALSFLRSPLARLLTEGW